MADKKKKKPAAKKKAPVKKKGENPLDLNKDGIVDAKDVAIAVEAAAEPAVEETKAAPEPVETLNEVKAPEKVVRAADENVDEELMKKKIRRRRGH